LKFISAFYPALAKESKLIVRFEVW